MDDESAVLDVLNVSQLTNGMLVSSFIYWMFYHETAYLKSHISQSVSLSMFAVHYFFFLSTKAIHLLIQIKLF